MSSTHATHSEVSSAVDSKTKWDDQGPLPPADYYIYDEYEWMVEGNKFLESKEFSPVSRNAIEIAYKIFLERDLRSYLNIKYKPEKNSLVDKNVDLICLTRRPPCYVIFGKPGVGRTTLAARLAEKLNAILINAVSVLEFYKSREPAHGIDVKEILESGGTVDDMMILQLYDRRIKELDVIHRGYVLDDFPFLVSEQIPISQQMQILHSFLLAPDFAIVFNMQDVDIFKKRINQKFDPETQELYAKCQYEKVISSEEVYKLNTQSKISSSTKTAVSGKENASSSTDVTKDVSYHDSDVGGFNLYHEEILDGSADFPPISFGTNIRLVSRLEDNSILVNDELEKYREASIYIQEYVDTLDKRNILEVNAYLSPSVIYKNVWTYLEGYGIVPSPVPTQIIKPMKRILEDYRGFSFSEDQEFYGESCESDDTTQDVDWEASYRAISVRGTIDPRFRWRISLWRNLCPVALKLGKSVAGRPEFAVSFLNKAYFLSSQEAVEQFIYNPRLFLLPEMPTSPIKFYVIGHPLAGKSITANELARLCDAEVVDMNKEVVRRYEQVKFDYLLRHKIQITFDAIRIVEKENKAFWKRGERNRRMRMHDWIDKHLKGVALGVIHRMVEDEGEYRAEMNKLLKASYDHKMQDPYMGSGTCQEDNRFPKKFSWEAFVQECRDGKINWTHQERLELAVDLFKQGKLYYKSHFLNLKAELEGEGAEESNEKLSLDEYPEISGEDDDAEVSDDSASTDYGRVDSEANSPPEDETADDDDLEDEVTLLVDPSKHQKKKCKRRKRKPRLTLAPDALDDLTPTVSSILDADDELEESILLRFPTIPMELVETVPKPDKVNEKHPIVDDIISRRMKVVEKNANEAEIYLEILRRGILEAEARYRVKRPGGPLTGGWIVDNLLPDIEKWRLILRTHDVSPDQVIVLVDHTPNYVNIFTRLKRLYRRLHPKLPVTKIPRPGETLGEDGDLEIIVVKSAEAPGEADIPLSSQEKQISSAETGTGSSDLYSIDGITETTETTDLTEDAPSLAMLIERDARRQQSIAGSKCTSVDDLIRAVGISLKESSTVIELYRTETGIEKLEEEKQGSSSSGRKELLMSAKRPNIEMGAYLSDAEKKVKCDEPEKKVEFKGEKAPANPEDFMDLTSKPINLLAQTGADSTKGADEIDGEIDGLFDGNKTPSGLLSLVDMDVLCPEDAGPEDPCISEKQKADELKASHPISGKRRFLLEIRQFELFWNMVIPVLNEQEIRYWEMGVVNEDTVKEKVSIVLEELEGRFRDYPREMPKEFLADEEADARESFRRWGYPVKSIRHYLQEVEDDEDEEDDESDETKKSEGLIMEDTDMLAPFEGKPDICREVSENVESLRLFGEFKEYCPVTYHEKRLLRKGFPEHCVKFQDRLYYFADANCKARFMINPSQFVPTDCVKEPTVPRICLTGSPGCGQEEVGLTISKEYGICYINFRERMHELIKARFAMDIGPNRTGVIIPLYKTLSMIAKAASGDDMLEKENFGEFSFPEEDEGESRQFYAHLKKYQPGSVDDVAIQSLGLINTAKVATNPMSSISRTEILARRKWKQLSKKEIQIKAFLENGTQLPDSILDEFIAPLWSQKPFIDVGFILVGFPSTEEDHEYLIRRNFIPEHVFVLESNPLAIRNRLLIETVDRWHAQNNPSGLRRISLRTQGREKPMAVRQGKGSARSATSRNSSAKSEFAAFEYQQEGRQEIGEFIKDTWTYDDHISKKISTALRHYHKIYSKDIINMKKSLNRNRVDWTPMSTDLSLIAAKIKLKEKLNSMLKCRTSILEFTVELNLHQANALINGGFCELSKFRRWCPVEILNGNNAINLWYSQTIEKIPVLHKRYIYFLAGKKHAQYFKENILDILKENAPIPAFPLTVAVLGNPKSGKTTVGRKLADYFGFTYISGTTMIENILKHSSAYSNTGADTTTDTNDVMTAVEENKKPTDRKPFNPYHKMITADEVLCYLENGKEIPNFILYRILDFALMDPKAQHHGVLFDDYPIDTNQLQDLVERGSIPVIVAKLNLEIKEAFNRNKNKSTNLLDFANPEAESPPFVQEETKVYNEKMKPSYDWFEIEIQSLVNVDASQSPSNVFSQIKDRCIKVASLIRNYTISIHNQKPVSLEGTSPLTSEIPSKISGIFGKYCPVSLNDNDELILVEDLTNLSRIIEYDSQLFAFSSDEFVKRFIADPTNYLPPKCARLPPADLPKRCSFTEQDFENLQAYWGFLDFDPVMYSMSGFHPKALQRGNPKFTVEYREKYYTFVNESNQDHFMKKPARFASVSLPAKLPRKFEPLDMEKISPYSYIAATGLLPELRKVINLLGTKRPRVPFMAHDRSCALYMAYYFKTLNMHAPFSVRQKYREAMFQMMSHKSNARDLLRDLRKYYGSRLKKLPEKIKKSLDEFLELATKKDEEKVLIPTIRDLPFNYQSIPPMDDIELTQLVEDLLETAKKADTLEKEGAFLKYCARRNKTLADAGQLFF